MTATALAGAPCATGTALPSTTCRATWGTWAATCTVPVSPQVGWLRGGLDMGSWGGPAATVTPCVTHSHVHPVLLPAALGGGV